MLTVRTQAIDGTRTFTSLDPQPCRLLPRCQRPSPRHYGSASRFVPRTRLSAGWFSRLQTFRYVQASAFASSPRSLLPLQVSPQGSRDFYVRAYRALLPPHAPDMLSAGIQVIDGKRTFTFPDLQPCRLLQCLTSRIVRWFPAPASSNPACRFPALGFPVCFTSRVMWPIHADWLSAAGSNDSVAVKQSECVVQPRRTPPLPAESFAPSSTHQVPPNLLLHPELNVGKAPA